MKKRQQRRPKRNSKLDLLTENVAQRYSQDSTEDIQRRHIVLACEENVVNDEITTLQFDIADARKRRARIEAELRGLALVVGKR